MESRLDECRWPELAPPFSGALREAVTYVLGRLEPTALLACGSILRGDGDAASDLDLYVLHRAPFRQRVQRFFGGVPTEVFVNPPWALEAYFESESSHQRPPATIHILATGFPVLSDDPDLAGLCERARALLADPPAQLAADLDYGRYGAALLLEDAFDVAERAPDAAATIVSQAVFASLEHAFRRAGRFVPRRKDWFRVLDELEPALAVLARRFYAAAALDARLAAAAEVADRVLATRGFYEWESERLPSPASESD